MKTDPTEKLVSKISVMRSEIKALKQVLSTTDSMVKRASRLSCTHGSQIYSSSSTSVTCEHCEILAHVGEIIHTLEGK